MASNPYLIGPPDPLAIDPVDAYLPDPADYAVAPYEPQTYQGQPFLESLGGLEGMQHRQPHGALEGFLYGLESGLGSSGTQALQRRAKFEADQTRRQAANDAERIAASRDYRRDLTAGKRLTGAERRANEGARLRYEQDNPKVTPEQIAQAPWLARVADPDGRVPKAALVAAFKPDTEGAPVPVVGPNGKAVLVHRSEAFGKAPANTILGGELPPEIAGYYAGLQRSGVPVPLGRGGVGSPAASSIARAGMQQAGVGGPGGPTAAEAGAQIAGAKASLQAGTSNLTNLTKAKGMTATQVGQLEKNSNMLLDLQKKIADTGFPILNSPIRRGLNKLGDEDQAAYNTALIAVQQEAARVQGASYSGAGVVHESDKDAIRAVIDGNFNGKQMRAVLGVLKREGQNRVGSLEDQIKEARQAVNAPGSNATAAPKTYGGIDPMQFVKKGR